MAKTGFAIECPHCAKWNEWDMSPEEVAVKSIQEFEKILNKTYKAREQTKKGLPKHRKLLRCQRPRWSCPSSFEAFIFTSARAAQEALERIPEKWAISRDFPLFKPDKKTRWEKRYYCIMFSSEPVPRQLDIELDYLMDRDLVSRAIVGMGYEIQAPATVFTANIFEPEGQSSQVFWMPIEAYSSSGQVLVPPRFNIFCRTCRQIVMTQLVERFVKNKFGVSNCPLKFGKNRKCAGREPACRKKPRDWNHCPAFIEERKKKCPCYNCDLNIIKQVRKRLLKGELPENGLQIQCNAGFTEVAFPIVIHDYLTAVVMTGQVFFEKHELAKIDTFVGGKRVQNFRKGPWTLLVNHKDKLENAKQVLIWDEENLRKESGGNKDENIMARFFTDKEDLEKRLKLLRPNIAKLEEMANIRYRDIRRRSENSFCQEILASIREYKMAADFFERPILNVLARMRDFWAFKVAGFLWYSSQTKEVHIVSLGSEKLNLGFGLPGMKIGEIDCAYQQSHPVAWLYETEGTKDAPNEWVNKLLPLMKKAKTSLLLRVPKEACYLFVAVPFADGVYAFVFAARDVASVSRLEPLRPGSVSELCKEFILRTCTDVIHELGDVRALREEHESAWREFSAMAAHRIGNEISSVGMLLDVLNNKITTGSELEEEWRDRLPIMRDCIQNAKLMLTQQTMLSGKVKPSLARRKVESLLRRAITGVLPETGILKLTGTAQQLKIQVDPRLMEQAFRELAMNAVQAVGKERLILTVRANIRGDNVVIYVRDNGPGIPWEHREHIFEPYVSFGESSGGLGLTTVRRIIEAHHGTINVGKSNSGARFIIRLPLKGNNK